MATITSLTYNLTTSGLGGPIGAMVANATTGNIFPSFTLAEATNGVSKYRCIYITAGNFNYSSLGLYFATDLATSGIKAYIGLGTAALNADEPTIVDDLTAPSGVTFLHPSSTGFMLSLPNLAPTNRIALWIKVVVDPNASGAVADYFRIYADGVEA